MAYLLDTNVLSELRKTDRCHSAVRRWNEDLPDEEKYLSVVVFGELRSGVENLRRHDAATALFLDRWLRGLPAAFAGRILPVTLEICDQCGRLLAEHNVPPADGLVAATAICHDLTVATRNERDFQRVGVDYFNPFTDGRR